MKQNKEMLLTVKLRCAGSELQVVGPAYSNSNIHSVCSSIVFIFTQLFSRYGNKIAHMIYE